MNTHFVDTAYYVALLGEADQYHERAVALSRRQKVAYVTTEFVLVEVGNFLVQGPDRILFTNLLAALRRDPNTRILSATTELFQRGSELFAQRPDKRWSLTDCISFRVMADLNIPQALTADHHFRQAGFITLLDDS